MEAPPIRCVARPDGLSQLAQFDAGRFGQHLALVGGQPRPVLHEVPRQLGGQSGAEGAHHEGERADGLEHGLGPLDDGRVATHHADELARGRSSGASGHPAIEDGHTGVGGLGADGRHAARRDRAHDDEDGVRTGCRQSALRPRQDGVDLGVVDHGHDHDVGPSCDIGSRTDDLGSLPIGVGGLGPQVVDDHRKVGGEEILGHTGADGAETDDPDRGAAPRIGGAVVGHLSGR